MGRGAAEWRVGRNTPRQQAGQEHLPCLCNLALGLELILLGRGGDDVLTLDDGNVSAAVGELGDDVVVGVGGEVGLNDDRVAPARRGGMDGEAARRRDTPKCCSKTCLLVGKVRLAHSISIHYRHSVTIT